MQLILYAFLAGAASAFAFEPTAWWPLLLIGFAALCEIIDRSKTLGRGMLAGWAFGVGQFAVGLNWIATAFTFQTAMPPWLGWVAVVLLSFYLAIYPALATGIAWRVGREDRVVMAMVLGGAWAIAEWLRGTLFTGFPWNPAAAALAPTPLITITPLIGTYGLSALVVLLGGAIWLEYYRKWLPLVVILGITALLWLLPSSPVPADPLIISNIRVVQPNIGQEDKWRPGFDAEAARRLTSLSGPPTGESRLLLWPEAAVTEPLQDQRQGPAGALAAAQRAEHRPAAGAERSAPDRRFGGLVRRAAPRSSGATNSVFAFGAWRQDRRPLRQGAPRPLWRISAHAAVAVGDRPVAPRPRRCRFHRRARARARSISADTGARSACSSATRSSFPGMSSMNTIGRASFSIPPTTPGSAAGDRRSISPRPAFAPPRKACRSSARRRPGSARSSMPTATS